MHTGGAMKKKEIDESLYDAVLYLHVLHTCGATQYAAVQSLAENAAVFGAAAEAFRSVITDAEFCGTTLYEGLIRLSKTTPSEKLSRFAAGYAASVRTAGTAFPFLDDAVDTLRIEAETAEKKYQESLAVMGEMYLTLFVAAPLFAVIAGLVLAMIAGLNPFYLELILYLLFPAAAAAFLLVLDSMQRKERYRPLTLPPDFSPTGKRDGDGAEANEFARLKRYDRKEKLRSVVKDPIGFFTKNPETTLFAGLPAGFLLSCVIPNPALQAGAFLLSAGIPFAVFFERKQKHQRKAAQALPDFFRVLGSAVSRGMTTAEAVSLASTEAGALQKDLVRTASAIHLGELADHALFGMANCLRISHANRAVILIAESSRFSADISPVLFELADNQRRLQTADATRRSGMSLYTAVIYLAFFVYLFVAGILLTVFLDAAGASGTLDAGLYERVLLTGSLVHAVCSGFAAGKMGEGMMGAGVKHVCVMTAVWVIFAMVCG